MYKKTTVLDKDNTITHYYQNWGETVGSDFGGVCYIFLNSLPLLYMGIAMFLVGIVALLALPFVAVYRVFRPACIGYEGRRSHTMKYGESVEESFNP